MSVGAQLQQARCERKLSLADVTRQTKIQPWVLEALEADRLQEMMSPIYVKGFLATYARFLHVDGSGLAAELLPRSTEGMQEDIMASQSASTTLPVAWQWPHWLLPLMGRLVPALAVGAALMGLVALRPQRWVSILSLPKLSVPKLASVTPVRDLARPPALPTLTLLSTQPLELAVSAERTTWIQITADGKLLTQQRLERGAQERWTAKKRFEVIVSKPSQVELVLNGQTISPFAIAHRGRLLITHRGVTKLPEAGPS